MALQERFAELCQQVYRLREQAEAVRVTAVEDRMTGPGGSALADRVAYAAEDAAGWVAEAADAAAGARAAVDDGDLSAAGHALAECHERFHRYDADLRSLDGYEQQTELARLARERRREWQGWVQSLRRGLAACRPPADGVSVALFRCWQELAERAGAGGVNVRASAVGVQKGVGRSAAPY